MIFSMLILEHIYLFTFRYKLVKNGFYYRWLLSGKENFVLWKEIESVKVFYEFGFLKVDFFQKKSLFKQKSFRFLVKKNIGEEPELEIRKHIPSNINIKYFKTTSSWHTLCLMINTLKSLCSFKRSKNER